jgi:hypothetical protein
MTGFDRVCAAKRLEFQPSISKKDAAKRSSFIKKLSFAIFLRAG